MDLSAAVEMTVVRHFDWRRSRNGEISCSRSHLDV